MVEILLFLILLAIAAPGALRFLVFVCALLFLFAAFIGPARPVEMSVATTDVGRLF